jgi:rare lipoprotein A
VQSVTDRHIEQRKTSSSSTRVVFAALLVFGLAACTGGNSTSTVPTTQPGSNALEGAYYKVGKPYQIAGTWYYPKEDADYTETGVASWYGPGFHGKKTANGERYDQTAMTAAHRTLPLPSVVRVTNLKNGRSIVLRVNDRGPFAKNRIIDVSQTAAKELGFLVAGTAPVRVEFLATESRRAVAELKEPGVSAPPAVPVASVEAQSLDSPSGTTESAGGDTTAAALDTRAQYAGLQESQSKAAVSAEADGARAGSLQDGVPEDQEIYVQVGAFSALHNAERMRARISRVGPTQISEKKTGETYLFRVRLGPVDSVSEADRIAALLQANDITDVHIVLEQP